MTPAALLAEYGIDLLRTRLLSQAPVLPLRPTRGDYDLNPTARSLAPRELMPAAVLLPIVVRAEPMVLLTRRSEDLPRHAGQISFPGGRVQDSDATLIATALREMAEETGITADFVSVAGFLDVYETGTGYAILPVVGMLREGFALKPDAREVAHVFEVPLAFLLDPANRQEHVLEWKGGMRRVYAFQYETHYIWGATAAMLVNFAERLHDAS
ncbi:MAG: CoA pyrophosphatase [Alphaproteobacteria bacterium]|nr:CoA pyrophosphatase [Alphaproteobacteria bacterium]MDE1984930.1 CoA pyrophosphatase [Alphaproteobacteria bacterium]MDE2162274.1 CoA pyrophosphatase [Alphaproteobacteria bacterium]MDE2265646.1 CoA pyrophosphatase [Alphaproteobacteria bacterium]MDE2500530.1 CoA pyrophosphatase [Alphaproteobacteria bacterium]